MMMLRSKLNRKHPGTDEEKEKWIENEDENCKR